ncbi:hypothetical protein [Oryza sativa Japonica Group]|uniref:Uncharacterized protein B1096D03.43 n=2 Tax=Oryza TaxID=4527 RepID=Q5VPY4_ORYSJ|nr:hypothetical protein [Oryza sativa Japonica Group]
MRPTVGSPHRHGRRWWLLLLLRLRRTMSSCSTLDVHPTDPRKPVLLLPTSSPALHAAVDAPCILLPRFT